MTDLMIGGERYAPVENADHTVAYDAYMRGALEDAGLDVPLDKDKPAGPQIMERIAESGAACGLVAGLVRPLGARWARDRALADKTRFEQLTSRRDRHALTVAMLEGLQAFYPRRAAILDDFPLVVIQGVPMNGPPNAGLRGSRRYGQWDEMLRVLSSYNPDFVEKTAATWHLRDALLAYENRLRQRALEEYRHAEAIYASIAPYAKKGQLRPPRKPRILRGR